MSCDLASIKASCCLGPQFRFSNRLYSGNVVARLEGIFRNNLLGPEMRIALFHSVVWHFSYCTDI